MTALVMLSRKAAALAILAALAALAYVAVVQPVESRIATALERIDAANALLARLELAPASVVRPAAERAAEDAAMRSLFVEGESEAVMTARLQTLLRTAASSASDGVRLTSLRPVAAREHDGLRLIGLEARFIASLTGLQKLLVTLEGSRPLILVNSLQISPTSQRLPAADRAEGASRDDARLVEARTGDTFEVRIEIASAAAAKSESPASARSPSPGPAASAPANALEPRPLEATRGKAL